MGLEQKINEYAEYLGGKKKAENTVKSYVRDLRKLASYLDGQGIGEWGHVTQTDLTSYTIFMRKSGCTASTMARSIVSIKSFFDYLYRHKVVDGEPAAELHAPRLEKKLPQILTVEETERLLAAPCGDTPKAVRDRAMLELMYATGIKVSELISLKITDVNLQMGYITCQMSQNGRIIPFGKEAGNAVQRYLEEVRSRLVSDDTEYLFTNTDGGQLSRQGFWKIIRKYGKKAEIDKDITPNMLRHSFAAHMVKNGADLKSVSDMLGNSDMAAMQMYAAFGEAKLREVYSKAHPRK